MSRVRDLHSEAMKLAQLAMLARETDNNERAIALAKDAFNLEEEAAQQIPKVHASEPTRSILFRSAASLAYQAKDYAQAQRMIGEGLSGYPPPEIEQQLKTLLEQIEFEKRLQAQGMILDSESLKLYLRGGAVGYGQVVYDEFIRRIKNLTTLIERNYQRMMSRNFQLGGRVGKQYRLTKTLLVPEPGSFSITVKLAVEQEQLSLISIPKVIEEILTGIELVNDSEEAPLRNLIPDEDYFNNFVALTRDMAPDGEKVTSVEFFGSRKKAGLTVPRSDLKLLPDTISSGKERRILTLEGKLNFASGWKGNKIGIEAAEGFKNIKVVESLDDLVRSYFGQNVRVTCVDDGKSLRLVDVQGLD